MKIRYLLLILSVLNLSFLQAQEVSSAPEEPAIFFDSVHPVWVAPTSGYWCEEETEEWNSCTQQYEKVIVKTYVSGTPGHYIDRTSVFYKKNGKVGLATPEVFKAEFNKDPQTSKMYNKYLQKEANKDVGFGFAAIGLGMFALPLCMVELEVDFPPGYFVVSAGFTLLGFIIYSANNDGPTLQSIINTHNGNTSSFNRTSFSYPSIPQYKTSRILGFKF
jgi:hypothetical protein